LFVLSPYINHWGWWLKKLYYLCDFVLMVSIICKAMVTHSFQQWFLFQAYRLLNARGSVLMISQLWIIYKLLIMIICWLIVFGLWYFMVCKFYVESFLFFIFYVYDRFEVWGITWPKRFSVASLCSCASGVLFMVDWYVFRVWQIWYQSNLVKEK
jgi:hypothetical protein